ncbi:flagellar brake protein [Variovorax sp. NFACC27]|uniref:flagellar brake protein n=1 Tax=unclassified Variovorax TaxID=663243 RepID=UPI00089810A9|nr:c-di-GMP-binding flagellar brake protein YcgR, contains PilZNR and PilZ domains [Variovorax sp. NFACC28]SEG82415.1 c-di-GMP-binding flagellar brake protein YcgR, contains PilZNR and PilZ domains [Variovorax sp. NFACC29]SFD07583.1 c-di-GMP-binding flagellar brake protein YcgR, contains PilZNR and PilZ domains [Variovorax sp. NFACC26]SFG19828.1 c-di-GMP-binding flagellar brake protein YcgR, contains PilZNR and PilZ domains [Variovorax sp. NFACC27]
MDTDQSNGQAEAPDQPHAPSGERTSEEFGRRTPVEIGVHLRNLASRRDNLTVQYAGGHLVTQLLDVDMRARAFTFDWGASPEQNRALLAAARCHFEAQQDGVRVEFSIASPRETRYEGLPAFEADFPEVLVYMQRREYFRVDAPIVESYTCSGSLPKGDAFSFEVQDLSLGGVGLRTRDARAAGLQLGTYLRDCELSLGTLGRLTLDMELVSLRPAVQPNGTLRYQLGFRFLALPPGAETALQRLVTRLEMKSRSLVG